MGQQLLTAKFHNALAQAFVDSFSLSNTTYYAFAAKSTPYPNNDSVSSINFVDNQSDHVQIYKDMLFGKQITNNSVCVLATRYDWVSNTVYAAYSDNDDLYSTNFYVCVNESNTYHVYKCLNNANNSPSTQQPTFADTAANDQFYSTSDGYQWKYLYTISTANFNKFATSNFIPVIPDANVTGNAVAGTISTIRVNSGGVNYENYFSGQFNASDIMIGGLNTVYNISSNGNSTNSFYTGCMLVITGGTGKGQYRKIVDYEISGSSKLMTINAAFTTTPDVTSTFDISPNVLIVGDGQQSINAEARALVNAVASNSVYSIEMLNVGAGYFYATANVQNSPLVGNYTAADITPVISPQGGHGANVYQELDAHFVGVSITFANTESQTIPATNSYREIGLIKNPLFQNVQLTIENSSGGLGSNGTFIAGETVLQDNTAAKGTISSLGAGSLTLNNVFGNLADGNNTYGVLRGQTSNAFCQVTAINVNGETKGFSTFDGCYRYIGATISESFTQNEQIFTSNVASANAIMYCQNTASNTMIRATEQFGVFHIGEILIGANSGTTMTISNKFQPDIQFDSGELLYVEGFNAITRSNTQTETFILNLTF